MKIFFSFLPLTLLLASCSVPSAQEVAERQYFVFFVDWGHAPFRTFLDYAEGEDKIQQAKGLNTVWSFCTYQAPKRMNADIAKLIQRRHTVKEYLVDPNKPIGMVIMTAGNEPLYVWPKVPYEVYAATTYGEDLWSDVYEDLSLFSLGIDQCASY